ncbi:MAG: enoyl-CoA hydratase/isomerase family protein, partial [Candidatus Limnocylindrales bacterium]
MRLDRDGDVATVTLVRPERRNAQTPGTWWALARIGRLLLGSDVRVVVLRGEGASFSAGLDQAMFGPEGVPGEPNLATLAALDAATLDQAIATFQEAFTWWRDDRVISVAAVQGHAVGAGFQLALACDLRILAEDARLSMRETSLGLVPDLGGTKPLVDLVGYARALEICVTGRWVQAAEAA